MIQSDKTRVWSHLYFILPPYRLHPIWSRYMAEKNKKSVTQKDVDGFVKYIFDHTRLIAIVTPNIKNTRML